MGKILNLIGKLFRLHAPKSMAAATFQDPCRWCLREERERRGHGSGKYLLGRRCRDYKRKHGGQYPKI